MLLPNYATVHLNQHCEGELQNDVKTGNGYLIKLRMKGRVFWSCASCTVSGNQKLNIKFVPYDPGSSFTIMWSHILPAKRHINIYTLCQSCLAIMGCTSFEEEMSLVLQVKDLQVFLDRKTSWTKKEWNFWVHSREFQEIHRAVSDTQLIYLHLAGSAALPLAKC